MKSFPFKIVIWFLALTILVSSVGVAQVTHICKMALAGMEKNSCSDSALDEHACCNETTPVANFLSPDDTCCSDEVRYFHNSIDGTLHEAIKPVNLDATCVLLLNHHFLTSVNFKSGVTFEDIPPGLIATGQKTIIFIQSFLI